MNECAKCRSLEDKIAGLERMQDSEQNRLTGLIQSFEEATYTTSCNFLDVHVDIGWVFRWMWVVTGLSVLGLFL